VSLVSTETWAEALRVIAGRVSPQSFGTWFQNIELLDAEEGHVRIGVANRFVREWLEEHYAETFRSAFAEVCGARPEVSFVISPAMFRRMRESQEADAASPPSPGGGTGAAPLPPPPLAAPSVRRLAETLPPALAERPRLREASLAPRHTFRHFISGPDNRLALAATRVAAERPGELYNPLFLWGASGVGKTHLLQAVCAAWRSNRAGSRAVYLPCEQFVSRFLSAVSSVRLSRHTDRPGETAREPALESFRSRCREVDLFAVDDIHLLSGKTGTQEEFCRTIDSLTHAGKQVVLAGAYTPKSIPGFSEQLIGRLLGGLVVRIDAPGPETRLELLRTGAARLGLRLPQEVLELLARRIGANVREIEGALARLAAFAELDGRQCDLHRARAALRGLKGRREGPPEPADVLAAVAESLGCKPAEIRSRSRARKTLRARQVVMYLARRLTKASLSEIGAACGGRDHATVLHAAGKIEALLTEDAELARRVEGLLADLGE